MVGKSSRSSPVFTRLGLQSRQSYLPGGQIFPQPIFPVFRFDRLAPQDQRRKSMAFQLFLQGRERSRLPVCSRKMAVLRPSFRSAARISRSRSSLARRSISRPGPRQSTPRHRHAPGSPVRQPGSHPDRPADSAAFSPAVAYRHGPRPCWVWSIRYG